MVGAYNPWIWRDRKCTRAVTRVPSCGLIRKWNLVTTNGYEGPTLTHNNTYPNCNTIYAYFEAYNLTSGTVNKRWMAWERTVLFGEWTINDLNGTVFDKNMALWHMNKRFSSKTESLGPKWEQTVLLGPKVGTNCFASILDTFVNIYSFTDIAGKRNIHLYRLQK